MNKTRHYIRTLLLMLLLVGGGTGNDAWAAKVRYHILTLPFSIRNYNNTGYYKQDIRVEALLVISDAPTVGLPEQYKSPLAKEFKYFTDWSEKEYNYLFHYSLNPHVLEVKYWIYTGSGTGEITKPDETDASSYSDIYVTYEYDKDGEAAAREIFLDKRQDYNITVGGDKFLCYNRSRNNRIANANTGALTGEDLVSEDFVEAPAGTGKNQLGFNWSTDQYAGAHGVHMGFWLAPTPYEYDPEPDPYNITLMTAYVGDETYQKDPVENEYFVKPYKGATLFCKISSNTDGKGTETKMWFDCDNDLHYKGVPNSEGINDKNSPNYWEKRVDYWPGYFRHTNQPIFNSVALLNHPSGKGYVFVGSKFNQGVGSGAYTEWAPNSKGNYATLTNDNNNPFMSFKTLASSPVINIYKIRKYTLKIKTHGSGKELDEVNMRWSDAKASDKIVDHLPDAFKRKYCSYKAYADEGLTKEITTFEDAIKKAKSAPADITIDGDNIVLWFDYTVTESFPFEALPEGGSYVNARWYTMRMNGKAEQKNIAYHDNNNLITADGSGDAKGDNASTKLHDGENSPEAQVAFMGDPYELKIISRKASETYNANRYIGCATGAEDKTTLSTNMTGESGISTWEMVYENTDMGNFILREFGTYASPKYIGWDDTKLNKPVVYSTTDFTDKNRIRVVELEKVIYTYHIVLNNDSDNDGVIDGDIAVKASSSHDVGKMLSSWEDIPEIIRSSLHIPTTPTATYYESIYNAKNNINAITSAPYDSKRDIYVRYSFAPKPTAGTFNVILNGEYLYTSDDAVSSKGTITGDEAVNANYQWEMDYSDPYDMTIQNKGNGKYVKFSSWSDKTAITWVDTKESASRFVVKKRAYARTYEVMAATGDDIDASVTYYNIGRPTDNSLDDNPVRLYSNSSYLSGNATLLFQFISTTAMDVTYHLIDKAGKDLLQAKTRQASDDKPTFPPEFHSPLVKAYHYYVESNFDKTGTGASTTYTLKEEQTEATTVSADIYVTYEVNNLVNLKAGQLYLMKYEAGEVFRQEDGNNGLLDDPAKFEGTDDEKIARYKAIYPYVNGDGNFFVYGEDEYKKQQVSASSRTRWVWYVQSDLGTEGDPYHVTIKSFQTELYPITNSSEYNAFFMTYKPDGYDQVVTTLAWPGMSGETATEYMVLGSEGQYQLVTTYPIAIDKNNNNTIDDGESERYVVDSFEQYWKTYDTIKKILLAGLLDDCDEKDRTDRTDGSIEVPTVPTSLRELLTKKKSEGGDYEFHSYTKWTYAKRWNGYNNGYSSTAGTPEKKKGWETREHWYQTVDMGQGYFDFVKASVDPVLILLDQHGWEIMRKPLPSSPDDPLKDAKYEAIRAYNSPMVKEYKFYSDNTKATGYHKYIPKTPITVDGKQYVSTSLTSLPPYETAVNVKDKKGNLNDQYVTYTVKDEYANTYSCSYSEGTATETVKPFLIQQGNYYVSVSNDNNIAKNTVPAGGMNQYIMEYYNQLTETGSKKNELWYIRPNRDIDLEMGMAYSTSQTDTTKKEPWTRVTTEDYYNIHHLNGFDPYNIQIQSVSSNTKYLVTDATGANVVDGAMEATYSASPTISLDAWKEVTGTGNDHNTLQMTNATFMVVQDKDGNMQLMPRFDHSHRMSEFGTLIAPTDAAAATTYTKLYRPVVYEYLIIDNDGHESLRYKSGGDMLPQTPNHFKSPLAKNFSYYSSAPKEDDTYTIDKTKKIEESLDGAELTNNTVYVRYEYDEDADRFNILKGNWMTMQLNGMDAQFTTKNEQAGIYSSSGNYSLTATNDDDRDLQAKYLTNTGDYYVRKGTEGSYSYEKIHVNSPYQSENYAVFTTTTVDSSSGWTTLTATDDDDMRSQAQKLTSNGEYIYRIGTNEPFTYVKVTVESPYQSETFAVCDPSTPTPEANSSNWDESKPLTVNADGKKWQWKFVGNTQSDPDPYAVYLFNRNEKNLPQPDNSRFALLSHSKGDYALAKAGQGDYIYQFLNGNGTMNQSTAAAIAPEDGFTGSAGTFSETNSQVKLTDEVQQSYIYKVYTNSGQFAIEATQTQEEAESNNLEPVLPEVARTPLLNIEHYRYYEQDLSVETPDTIGKSLSKLYGLYDDIVYTHYTPYNDKESNYLVPNVRNATNEATVARGTSSNDAPIGLDGKRLYNIIWHPDNMMKANDSNIESTPDQSLQNNESAYQWTFEGDDPYAIKIKSVGESGKYIHKATSTETDLSSDTSDTPPLTFMLLNKDGYDYGVLAKTGEKGTMLSGYGNALTTNDPTNFIIFALSTYKVIYHLIIANIDSSVSIPYAELKNGVRDVQPNKEVKGSTLRDLKSTEVTTGTHIDGDKYQLGESLSSIEGVTGTLSGKGYIYCKNVGNVSLGDVFKVPSEFYRPNVNYDFYIEGVYDKSGNEDSAMNNLYKGLKLPNLGDDSGLLDKIVCVNIVYSFMGGLDTNSGSDFVKKVDDNKWYTFETSDATPRLAEYTGSLQTKEGHATHYTDDYLWTPVGDPYGFKMYNRYAYKTSQNVVITSTDLNTGTPTITMSGDVANLENNNAVYELLSTNTTTPGYFIIHPVVNITGLQYYMNYNSSTGAMTLNRTPKEWTFGLSEEMMRPYYQAAGYVGGLNEAGKAAYDVEAAKTNPLERLMGLQDVVYNHDNDGSDPENTTPNYIVHYAPGYYRLHNQPGSEGISTPRYASGYTHKTELTAGDGGTAIPMHFYEMPEYTILNPVFSDLNTANSDNYTSTVATRGDIPLSTVTYDPASIFKFTGETPSIVTMSTQGLCVNGGTMNEGSSTSFSIVDIGGGVIALKSGENYLSYKQTGKIYDLKYGADYADESARWSMQPVQKTAKAGDGEMGLMVKTYNGDDGYYYASFYAPFDALLTSENDVAYVVEVWPTSIPAMIHPKKIGNFNTEGNSCPEKYRGNNQFVPAGTPVIIRTTAPVGYVTMALPTTTTPSTPVTTALKGEYIEQMLQHSSYDVYAFGRSLGTYQKASDFDTSGLFESISPSATNTSIGFYVNANPNKETGASKSSWIRNNKYVYANKIYYLYTPPSPAPSPSRELKRSPEFIPVVFDDEDDDDEELQPDGSKQAIAGDNRVYDLQGRCVATEEMVKDGTWRRNLTHGIYILNGKKIYVK